MRAIPLAAVHFETASLPLLLITSIIAIRSLQMPEPSSSPRPRRRVGVYERLRGPAGGSPARLFGIGVGVLVILIVLIVVLARYV